MIHAAAPHFLWSFAVRYATHQLNLWPRVSLPETSPTLLWTGEVGDASVFRVWGSRAFVCDTSVDKLSARAIPCVFLGFVPDAPGWQFYHPTSHRILPSKDVTFDESAPFYPLFPYRSAPPSPALLFLAPGPPPVDPLPLQGPAPLGVSQIDPLPCTAHVEVALGSGATRGSASEVLHLSSCDWGCGAGGAECEGAGSGGAKPGVEEPGGAEPAGVEPGGAESVGAESGGAEPRGAASSGGHVGALPRLSPQQLREWLVRRTRLRSGATGARGAGDARAGGAGVTAGAGGTRGTAALGPRGNCTKVDGATATGGVGGAGAGGAGVGGTGAGGAGAAGAGAVDPGVGGARGTMRPRPYFVPLLQQVLGVPSSTSLTPSLLCPPPDQSQSPLLLASPLPATAITHSSFESSTVSALVAELLDFAAACRLDYATALVAKSASASPLSVGEGDMDAPDIPTPRSYAEVITGPYSSHGSPQATTVKRPPGSPPAFKAHYVARGFSQRQGRDYELLSLDFCTAFLQGTLHEEIWLHRPPGFTGSFPAGTKWSLRPPVYGFRQKPREWHNTLRTTLAALGFAPSTADPSLFLRTDTSLPPFYVLMYIDDLVFATADIEALTLVLQCFGFQFSLPQPTPLSTSHSHSGPPSDESIEPSGPYLELVGCLVYLMTCTRPYLAYPLSLLARYVAPDRNRKVHWVAAKRVLRYLCSSSGMGLVLGGRGPVVLTNHRVDDSATQQSSQGFTFSPCFGSVSWRSTRSSSVLSSSCEAEIYAGAMAAQ
ncbi:unnamed protein product [Closterium sp. NIES-53]